MAHDNPDPTLMVFGPGGKRSRITNQADRRRSRKGPSASTSDPTAVDANGMLVDVDVQEIEAPKVARVLLREENMKWDPTERRINCLAHVINLATQKLISTYSKASHFNIHDSNAHIPDTSLSHDGIRDEIGLLRAIAVKERSSAKRKELSRGIQIRDKTDPDGAARQMIPDMKVRWSSTYAMLDRQLQEVNLFFIRQIIAVVVQLRLNGYWRFALTAVRP
ncbi:hypothetical protein B0H14DRAFT_2640304 [Mycena olivaceomarginata]|nr:hypothetical protein B0H14DRAFT_2640304 [Mycena olivaceomarginata]